MTKRAVITGVGHYLPKRIVPNSEFEKTLNTSDDWIITRSGIRRRLFSNEDETKAKELVIFSSGDKYTLSENEELILGASVFPCILIVNISDGIP